MATFFIMVVVFIFDAVAFGLAVAAEERRGKVIKHLTKKSGYCIYDSDISTMLGVSAFLLLLASQVLLVSFSKCFCCGRALQPSGSRACSLILFLISWVTFAIAESCLLAGSVRNAYHTKLMDNDTSSCQTLRKGVFDAGAAFVFFTTILTELYIFFFSKAKAAEAGQSSSIPMSDFR